MTTFLRDISCCGSLNQTTTFDDEPKFRIAELEPTVSTGMSVKTPNEIMKDLLQLGINKKSNLEVYEGMPVEKVGRKKKDGVDEYMAKLSLYRPDHILELLLAQEEAKPGLKVTGRSQIWRSTFKYLDENIIKANEFEADTRPSFSSFGNQEFQQMLTLLCQVNPFFASALTFSQENNTLELIAYKEGEHSE